MDRWRGGFVGKSMLGAESIGFIKRSANRTYPFNINVMLRVFLNRNFDELKTLFATYEFVEFNPYRGIQIMRDPRVLAQPQTPPPNQPDT